MGNESLNARFLNPAAEYIGSLPVSDQASIAANIVCMRSGDFTAVRTKQLKGAVRELIVGHHRLTYFLLVNTLYFVRGFRKKTAKAPRAEIEYAEKIYKTMKNKR